MCVFVSVRSSWRGVKQSLYTCFVFFNVHFVINPQRKKQSLSLLYSWSNVKRGALQELNQGQTRSRPPQENPKKSEPFFSAHRGGGRKTFGFGKGWLSCICMYYPNTTGI